MDFELCLQICMKCLLSNFTCATEVPLLKASKNWSLDIPKSNFCHDAKRGEGGPRSNVIMMLILVWKCPLSQG